MISLNKTQADRLFAVLFLLFTALNVLVVSLTPLTLSPDETHYWEWSRRLDWSYYSKGPVVALVIAVSTWLVGDSAYAVRLPAILFYAAFSGCFYFFIRRMYSPGVAILAWVLLRSSLIFIQTGILMTTDAPAEFFWLIAMIAGYFALFESRSRAWWLFGLCIGLGMMAKYTVFLLYPSVAMFLLCTPKLRQKLWSRDFLIGLIIFAISLSPILIWNAQHGWVNFAHNAGHLSKSGGGFKISPQYLPELILGQAGLVGPILFSFLGLALVLGYRLWKDADLRAGYFFCSVVPLGILVTAISLTKRVYANWPLPMYVGGFLLLAHLLSKGVFSTKRYRTWIYRAMALNFVIMIAAHLPFMGFTYGLPGSILPTKKLIGWDSLGQIVGEKSAQFLARGEDLPFVLAESYEIASTVAFYADPRPEVYCAMLDGRRMNQYDVWGGVESRKGDSAIIIVKSPEKIAELRPHFESISEMSSPSSLRVAYSGTTLNEYFFYLGKGYDGSTPEPPTAR